MHEKEEDISQLSDNEFNKAMLQLLRDFIYFIVKDSGSKGIIKKFFNIFDIWKIRHKIVFEKIEKVLKSEHKVSSEFINLVCETIIASFSSRILVKKILEFNNYRVTIGLLTASLKMEIEKGKKFLTAEQKSALITKVLDNKELDSVFVSTKILLFFAKTISYEDQERLLSKYLELHGNYVFADDLLDVYELWQDMALNLRIFLNDEMKKYLRNFRLSFRKINVSEKGGMKIVDYSKNPSPYPGNDDDLN